MSCNTRILSIDIACCVKVILTQSNFTKITLHQIAGLLTTSWGLTDQQFIQIKMEDLLYVPNLITRTVKPIQILKRSWTDFKAVICPKINTFFLSFKFFQLSSFTIFEFWSPYLNAKLRFAHAKQRSRSTKSRVARCSAPASNLFRF